jgi:diguanylate cyclase (GGDEF)-like protein
MVKFTSIAPLRLSLRAWLLLASLVSALPMLVFALYSTGALVRQHAQQDEADMVQRADAVASAVRTRLDAAAYVLQTIANSEAGVGLDMLGLLRQAERVHKDQPDVVSLSAVGPDGHMVFNTLRPFGTKLPISNVRAGDQRVFTHGEVAYTAMYVGAVSGMRAMTVAVPLRDHERPQFALRMNLDLTAFASVIEAHPWPPDWTVAVLDPLGTIAARNRDASRFVGELATQPVLTAIAARNFQLFESITKDGIKVRATVRPVPGTDWFVAVAARAEPLYIQLWHSLGGLLIGGLACLALGWVGAWLIARHVGAQLHAPNTAGRAGSAVREIAELRAEAAHSAERAEQLTALLSTAQRDALTGLPTRAVFIEHATRLLAQCPPEDGCALLFMDLDGFKSLNDRLGHQAGDDALVRVGELLGQSIRAGDLCARLGGDEFVVLTAARHELLREQCERMARRLVDGAQALGDGLGASLGVALARNGETLEALLERADRAMYAAKHAGSGTYRFDAA